MILEKQTENLELEEGVIQKSYNTEIDFDSAFFLKQMLSKFYSDSIGSLIRETASNALDSQRDSGTNEPIIVSFLRNKDGHYEFSVEDFGVGIDSNTIDNILRKYGKSTRRNDSDKLGLFGLGFKSPLAYSSSFYFIGRKNGIETKAMMYEGEDDIKIDILYEKETTERNGVKVIVPVKYSDKDSFYRKIKEQLSYFEGVYFNCGTIIPNDFKIVRSEHFQWSSLISTNELHLCLDNVYYPIDYNALGISRIYFPVALKFGLSDGIFPVPQRESIKYTKEAKEIILNKIKLVSEYFVKKYNETIKDCDDIHSVIKFHSSVSREIVGFGNSNWDVKQLEQFSPVKISSPNLTNVKLINTRRIYEIKEFLFKEYTPTHWYKSYNGRFENLENNKWSKTLRYDNVLSYPIYVYTGTLTPTKKSYLKEEVLKKNCYFVKKDKVIKLGKLNINGSGYDNYISLLDLRGYPKSEWRERIKEFQYILSLLTKDFIDLKDITVPQSWIDSRKKQKVKAISTGTKVKKKKLEGEIIGKVSDKLERYVSGKNCKFISNRWQMNTVHRDKYILIYGSKDNEDLLQSWYSLIPSKYVKFAIFSDRELTNLQKIEIHNWIHIDKFMEGKHKLFKRIVTAYLINNLYNKYSSVFNKTDTLYKVSSKLSSDIERLDKYKNEYYISGDSNLYTSILEIANEHNLFDTSIYDVYLKTKKTLEKLYFLNVIIYSVSDEEIQALRDLFKYHKEKIDWEYYNQNLINKEDE
jgi:hypothetical protein